MGGLGGHMAHLSEDLDLTFQDIIDVLGKVARADIKNTTEKVDGQNLFLSVDSMGLIRTARNSSDIKRGGMTPEEYIEKWRGHPAESAFTNGFRALTTALKRLDPQTLQNLFSGGERYINMEIMYPENPNIIHYAAPQVVLHGLKYVGSKEDKEEQKRLEDLADEAFDELVSLVDAAEATVGEELWTINGPKIVELRRLADGTALAEVEEQIRDFARPLGVDATLKDLVKLYLRQFAREEGLPDDITDSMMMLLFDPEKAAKKGIKASSLKKGLPPDLKAVVSKLGTKTNSKKVIASILHPLEVAISDFAIEVLRGLQSFFVSEHDKEVLRMQQELQQSIEHLQALSDQGDVKMGELIDKQLAKLKKVENVASTLEGVVFEYPPGSGKVYKLTGAFAMANQIIGRARRSGMNEGMSKQITIKISKTRDVTKTAQEWINEMRANNHTPKRIPNHVYTDIMNGVPLVDIVRKEDAQEAIYNTVYTHINHEIKETVELEIVTEMEQVDAANADGTPYDMHGKTYALVPGAMKPPTLGHISMIQAYAARPEIDEVLVLVSNPTKIDDKTGLPKSARGFKGLESGIKQGQAIDLLQQMLHPMPDNIKIVPTQFASPMEAAFAFVSPKDLGDIPGGQAQPGDKVILGSSTKRDSKGKEDKDRWNTIINNQDAYVRPGVTVMNEPVDPLEHEIVAGGRGFSDLIKSPEASEIIDKLPTVVKARKRAKKESGGSGPELSYDDINFSEISASDARHIMGFLKSDQHQEIALELLRSFFGRGEGATEAILQYLGLRGKMQETSCMAGGGMTGAGGPAFGPSDDIDDEEDDENRPLVTHSPSTRGKRKRQQRENLYMSLVNEVYTLFIERGILT